MSFLNISLRITPQKAKKKILLEIIKNPQQDQHKAQIEFSQTAI
jgi:hypothetical protein